MNVLLTGAASPLGGALAAHLTAAHRLRLTDRHPSVGTKEWLQSDLDHDDSTDALVAGIDAVVHLPGPGPGEHTADRWLDTCCRGTYNLLHAAAAAGVQQVIYLSTLDLFEAYGPDAAYSPQWRPRPTDEPRLLGLYLGEFTAREFAREQSFKVLCMRLAQLQQADQVTTTAQRWVDPRDVAGAVNTALTSDLPIYSLHHLWAGAGQPQGRRRRRGLDYQLRFPAEENR
ncbi:MAG: NAD-dependent epimerase/dehydratase family protein [Candidatus Latescibacteria bacterium]|nr:NAD-dependent epimerase/dehydratase family protein [Candidatus Latescibacterota bacterium]